MSHASDDERSARTDAGQGDDRVEDQSGDADADTAGSGAQTAAASSGQVGDAGGGGGAALDDPNTVAIGRAEVDPAMTEWLHQVAGQVEPRLDRVAPDWRQREQAQAARACAFGLLLAHLARSYPHARPAIHQVVEQHPSYSTLTAGERLATLERIVATPDSMTAWVGPLIGVTDPQQVRSLLD